MLSRFLVFFIIVYYCYGSTTTDATIGNDFKCEPPLRICDVTYKNGSQPLCYPEQWHCDGHVDCEDGTDEPASCEIACKDGQFKCATGRCLPRGFLCDGGNDCGSFANGVEDMSDEAEETCNRPIKCRFNEYQCAKSPTCIPLVKFCDGVADCPDSSDEHTMCNVEDSQAGEACPYGAAMTLDGLKCYCPTTKFYNNQSQCEFINFCEMSQHGHQPVCSHKCKDLQNGTFECSCYDPRMKLANGTTCVSDINAKYPDFVVLAQAQYIVFGTNYTDVLNKQPFEFSKSDAFTLAYQLPAYENVSKLPVVCHTDTKSPNTSFIACHSSDTPSVRKSFPIEINLKVITILEYDELGDNWILSDGQNFVSICKNDEKRIYKCRTVPLKDAGLITQLIYDQLSGYLFYAESETSKSIGVWRIDLSNGKKKRMVYDEASVLAIDPFTRTLYFDSSNVDYIRAVDYDLSYAPRVVVGHHKSKTTKKMIYSEGKLMVLMESNRIFVYDVLKSNNQIGQEIKPPEVLKNTKGRYSVGPWPTLLSIMFYRKKELSWKWKGINVCKKAGCEDICIGSWEQRTTCLCEDGAVSDGAKCKRITAEDVKQKTLLVYAQMRPSSIVTLELNEEMKGEPVGIRNLQNVKRPSSVTVDAKNGRLIAYDLNRHALLVQKIGDESVTVHRVEGVLNCEGMAYDHNSDNLYMTDQGRRTVSVTKLGNLALRKVLIRGNMTNPRAIVLHLKKSYMFWGSWSERNVDGIPPKIERAKLDGSERKTLVSRNAMWINGLAVDDENDFLYWCDAFRNVIERIRFNGSDREIVVQGATNIHHPYGLAFFQNSVFWTEFKRGKVKRLNLSLKTEGSVEEVLSQTASIFEMSIVSGEMKTSTTVCSSSSNTCEQFCFASSCKGSVGCQPITCGCADGLKLTSDGKCEEDKAWKDPDSCDDETQFTCRTTKKCISKESMCDGDEDCGDGSDEDPHSTCKDFECTGKKFKCDGVRCHSLSWRCDGSHDCLDGSDESEEACKEVANSKKSSNRKPIVVEEKKKAKFCQRTEFRCGNGDCIETFLVCDGIKHCRDGLDEAHCDKSCHISHQFRCKNGSACMDIAFRCDGVADCDDGSDESEENCKQTKDTCSKSNEFKCADGRCIRASHLCDGFADCLSGEDEIECPAEMCNPITNFVCRGGKKCIAKQLECDGVNDCGNNSDEDHCTAREDAAELRCQLPMYRCEGSGGARCISDQKLCDGIKDCPHNDDEGAWCNDTCSIDNQCSHICRATRLGEICTCPEGHYLDDSLTNCIKEDPCRFGQCSQLCTPHGSSKFCYCENGFKLQPDRFTCVSEDPQRPFIIYTNRHEIRVIKPMIPGSTAMIASLTNSIALDFRFQTNGSISIIWTDLTTDRIYGGLIEAGVVRYQRVLVSYGVFVAEGVAIDWITGNIYWIDTSVDTIEVVSFDGSRRATVLSEDMSNARSLCIDPAEGYMFWTDWQESRPRIERASMAGTGRKVLWNVTNVTGAGWPNGIASDTLAKRIYWVDARSDSIHTITYEGMDHRVIIRNSVALGHPFGIDVFEGWVYFSDWRTNTINKVNKWNGSDFTVVERVANQPFSLKVVHKSKQNRFLKNPCENEEMKKSCNGICLIDGKNSAKCHCTSFQKEMSDGSCAFMDQILLVATGKSIQGLSMTPPHSFAFPLVSGKEFEDIRAVSGLQNELRILNSVSCHITALKLNGVEASEEVKQIAAGADLIGISGMTIDEYTGTTYFTIAMDRVGRIEAVSRDGKTRKTLVDSTDMPGMMKMPRDIVFIEKTRNLYWFDDGTSPPGIYSIHGDGFGPMKIDIDSKLCEGSQNPVVNQDKQWVFWISLGKLVGFDIPAKKVMEIKVPGVEKAINAVGIDRKNGDLFIGLKEDKLAIHRFKFDSGNMEGGIRASGDAIRFNLKSEGRIFMQTVLSGPENTTIKTVPDDHLCASCPTLCLRGINVNSIVCHCSQGYTLESGVCRPAEKRVFFVTDDGTLNSVGYHTTSGKTKKTAVQYMKQHILHADVAKQKIVLMTVDTKKDLIYAVTRQNEVWKCATNGSFARRVFVATTNRIAAITLDSVTGYLLISERVPKTNKGVIVLLDPSRSEEKEMKVVLLEDEEKVPYELAIDPPKGKIFWASASCIKSANYDGSNIQCINNKKVFVLAVDELKSRVCYIDDEKTAIDCIDYDGKNEQKNVATFRQQTELDIVGFVINGDEMFYFDKFNMSGSIIRSVRQPDNTFAPVDAVIKTAPRQKLRLHDIEVMDSATSNLYTACSNQNGGCEHLCITTPAKDDEDGGIQKQCLCVHSELGENGHCRPSRTFIAVSRFSSIAFVQPSPNAPTPPYAKITTNECFMLKAGALAADIQRNRIYFADNEKFRITSVNYDGSGCFVVAEDIGYAASIAYDEVHQDIYYARTNPPGIWRINVAENDLDRYPAEPSIVLALTLRDRPRKIAINPCRMLIFFANNAVTGSVIERVFFSGYKREMVIQEDLSDVRGLAIDLDAEKLYFTDAKDFRMSRCDYDGSHREVVFTNWDLKSPHPFDLAVYRDEVIATDWIEKSLVRINKITGDINPQIGHSTDISVDVVIIDPDMEYCAADACANNDLKCEDYCRLMPDGNPTCACNGERRLNKDNRTCSGDIGGKKCAENEFNCMTTDICIPYEETCDGYNDCLVHDDEDIKFCSTRKCRAGYFSCGNGMCIAESKRCNRVNDCVNFADENNCTCSESEFRCDSGLCIPQTERCDFKQDCNDASDEKGCPFRNCSALEEHGLVNLINCATTTQCILPAWKCDGANDCFDGWDETDCLVEFDESGKNVSPPKECDSSTSFACLVTRTCMPKHWRCDGHVDCGDGSDEKGCAKTCDPSFEFTCKTSGRCIPMESKCDEVRDCPDGEDEVGCAQHECANVGNTTFQCTNHRCIPMTWRCDGTDDCMDNAKSVGSDELDCGGRTSFILPLRCANESCEVPCELTALLCDGVVDCADGFDEHNCASPDRQCEANQWMCNSGQCIESKRLCDESVDCIDGSDEWVEICSISEPPKRGCPNSWSCLLRSGRFGCLKESQLCDGKDDCLSGIDERCDPPQGNCSRSNSCDQPWNCQNRAGFEKCSCDPGYYLSAYDQGTCLRSPACSTANCSHFCIDRRDVGHQCFCASGYILSENGRDCRRNDTIEPEIVLIFGHRLKLFTLDGHSKATLLMNLTNGVSVDYDIKSDLIYWTDIAHNGNKAGIISMSNQPHSYQIMKGLPTKGVDGIAVDWLGRNIYYTDRHQDAIAVCDMRGRFQRVLLKGSPLNDPRAIVLDPLGGLIFWTDWGTSAHIGRMNMDGSEPQVLLQDRTIRWPNALAIDAPAHRLYFGDAHRDYIGSCNYDGTKRRIVLRNAVRHIFALSVFEDYIYWTDWHNHTVERAHKITGEERKVLIHDKQYRPMGFKIIHPALQSFGSLKTSKHPCSQPARCDNLCIPADTKEQYSCMCAQGFRAEGRSCVSECKPLDMVCSGTYKCIASWWKCDGQDDCGDGEDEGYFQPGVCPPFPCEAGQYVCSAISSSLTSSHPRSKLKVKSASKNSTSAPLHPVCLYRSALCDGNMDCPLGDDEEPEFCKQFECGEQHFKCADNKKCVPSSSVCDRQKDCEDGSDEKDCEIKDCGVGFFACLNETSSTISKCIPNEFYCDGEIDCPQAQDEPNTCVIGQCTSQQFRCKSGRCIPEGRRCDGQVDCRDESDEKGCEKGDQCPWQCEGQCMALDDVCDGRKDCVNGGDESEEACVRKHLMGTDACPNRCDDESGCNAKVCDGVVDCDDGKDEKNCDNSCKNVFAKNSSLICDGKIDCPSGVDETNCAYKYENLRLYQCPKQAVEQWEVCDGVRDCADGMDEDAEMCAKRKAKCGRMGTCDNRKECFDVVTGMCDGVKDCSDGSDEDPRHCDHLCQGKFRCTDGRCIDKSARCDGNDDCGDRSDEETCGESRCSHFGLCSQHCAMTISNRTVCMCMDGYVRSHANKDRCVPLSNFTELLIANGKTIHWMTLPDDATLRELNHVKALELDVITGGIDIAYEEQKTKLIYSTAINKDRTTVDSMILFDSLTPKKLRMKRKAVSKKKNRPTDTNALMAYDDLHGNVYSTETSDPVPFELFQAQGNIYISRFGNVERVLIVNSTGTISSIAVSPEANCLFWSTTVPVARILIAELDGSSRRVPRKGSPPHKSLVETSVFNPRSLVADTPNMRLYWIDAFKRTVECVHFWQNDRRVVKKFALGDTPMAMDILADDLFVITKKGVIHQMHKFSGHSTVFRQKLVAVSPLISLKVANPAKFESMKKMKNDPSHNLCSANPCPMESVCVPVYNEKQKDYVAKCLCAESTYYDKSTKSCQVVADLAIQCGDYFCYNNAVCNLRFPINQQCLCPPGFYGKQCEISQCTQHCFNGATCEVFDDGRHVQFECKCAANYTNSNCETHICDGVCGPRGTCKIVDCPEDSKPACKSQSYCECEPGWEGPQCRHKVQEQPCNGYCFNNGICSGSTQSKLHCFCPKSVSGTRCENCENLKCMNGGFCTQKLDLFTTADEEKVCFCPPGFGGKHCEIDYCEGACPYGQKCVYNTSLASPIQCECHPNAASRSTDCEPICEKEKDWCRNGGKCFDLDGSPGMCQCPPRFSGPRCEKHVECSDYCLNESSCMVWNSTDFKCICRKGFTGERCERFIGCDGCWNGGICSVHESGSAFCTCPKGLGGKHCEIITATSCGQLDCSNGGVCYTSPENKKPMCNCPPGWSGLLCRQEMCTPTFCENGGECHQTGLVNRNQEAACKCPKGFYGSRCQYDNLKRASSFDKFWMKMLWFLLIAILAILILLGFTTYRSRFSMFRQFRHSPMQQEGEPGSQSDQFSNPAYLADESGGIEMTTVNTSLVTPQERNAFSNPVFEQEMVPIYNDTVENAELLSSSDT